MFKINPNNPTNLKMVGSPVCSGGEFPMSIAVSEDKNMVCVLNGGVKNGVSCVLDEINKGHANICLIDAIHRILMWG